MTKNSTAINTISCKVSLGLFSDERAVSISLAADKKVSAIINKRQITVDHEPKEGEEVNGRVEVTLVQDNGDSVIVDLPQPGLTEGPRLVVPKSLLR